MTNMLWNLLLVTMYSSIASCIVAGPIPMPLEAQLDLASDVVVGRIVKITPVKENLGEGSHCGRITVEVKETLLRSAIHTAKHDKNRIFVIPPSVADSNRHSFE